MYTIRDEIIAQRKFNLQLGLPITKLLIGYETLEDLLKELSPYMTIPHDLSKARYLGLSIIEVDDPFFLSVR